MNNQIRFKKGVYAPAKKGGLFSTLAPIQQFTFIMQDKKDDQLKAQKATMRVQRHLETPQWKAIYTGEEYDAIIGARSSKPPSDS